MLVQEVKNVLCYIKTIPLPALQASVDIQRTVSKLPSMHVRWKDKKGPRWKDRKGPRSKDRKSPRWKVHANFTRLNYPASHYLFLTESRHCIYTG